MSKKAVFDNEKIQKHSVKLTKISFLCEPKRTGQFYMDSYRAGRFGSYTGIGKEGFFGHSQNFK